MPTHIEHMVTDVTAQPEESEAGPAADPRFSEQSNVEALLKRAERMRQRLSADGFDD